MSRLTPFTPWQLLDHEPRAAKQVPLLLNMKEDDLALVKSIESGDPDLGRSPTRPGSY
jgi:hypothetical protein